MHGAEVMESHDRALGQVGVVVEEIGDRFSARLADIEARRRCEREITPLWLSHHWPGEYDRCIRLGRRHVCRRCAVLYAVGLTVAVATVAGLRLWPAHLDLWIVWLACVPATAEFVLEQLGVVRHHPTRQAVLTGILAVAFGRGLGAELEDRWDWLFWGPILVYCTIWFAAAAVGRPRRAGAE